MERQSIEAFMERIARNIELLRARLRSEARIVRHTLNDARSDTGDVYVESVGAPLKVEGGLVEFFYEPNAFLMRDNVLRHQIDGRVRLFDAIARQVPHQSRVLVVGAGGDVVPIQALIKLGHEAIATDVSEETVEALRARTEVPAFACDLVNLPDVLPEPVDFMLGNSVLGYIDPQKLRRVIRNLTNAMRVGAVFTFDLTPHPHYFNMAEDTRAQTIVNESAANPRKLLAYLDRFGIKNGIAAMASFSFYRGLAVNLAVVSVLRTLFEEANAKCVTSKSYVVDENGMKNPVILLRVYRGLSDALGPTSQEVQYNEPTEALSFAQRDAFRPGLELLYIDRTIGEALARKLGIHVDQRRDPWLVAEYIYQNPPTSPAEGAIHDQIMDELDPKRFAEQIKRYVDGERFERPTRMSRAVHADQFLHKAVLMGELPIERIRADQKIDSEYENERDRLHAKDGRRAAEKTTEKKRDDRKRRKRDRKKQRKH